MTFDYMMTFEKHHQVFHDRLLLGKCFGVLSFQVWSTVLQSGARLPLHTLDYWTA